jgi:hypothetical protein
MQMNLLPTSQLQEFADWLDRRGFVDTEPKPSKNSIVRLSKKIPNGSASGGNFVTTDSIKGMIGIGGEDFLMIDEHPKTTVSWIADFKAWRKSQ